MAADPDAPPRRGDRHDRMVLVVALLAFALATVGAVRLTLIPAGLDERVQTTTRSTDGPPYDSFWLYERELLPTYGEVVRRAGGREAVRDQPLRKEPWATTLTVGDRTVDLTPPLEFWKQLGALAAVLAVALLRWRQSARATSGRSST